MAAYRVSPDEKEKIIAAIRAVLTREHCLIALLFGSFLTEKQFRDIDICVAWSETGGSDMTRASELAEVLQDAISYPFDIVPLSIEDVPLRASISKKFQPILNLRPDLLDDFLFKAWIDHQDYRGRIETFYAERF